MPRIGKGWINTAKEQEVNKHPILAGLQRFRNALLKWKIKKIDLNSARIGPLKTEHGPTGDLVHKCLRLLSEDLGEPKNRATAYDAIKSLVTYTDNWNDSLSIVLPVRADKLQRLRMNVKKFVTEYTFDTKETKFLQAVYNKSDAVLAYPKGRYHEKFDAPAPREVPPANNAPRPANAGAGQTTADVPSPAAQVESASHGHASVQPDEIKPQDGSVEIKTNGQSAAPSTDEIVQPREKAAGASRDSIDAELDKVLHNLDSLAGTQQTEVGAQTPNTGQKGIVSSNLRVPKLQLPKHVQQNGTPLSTPGRTPRPRLTSNVEPKPKIQSARPPAPEKLPESKDVKVEGNGPPDNPVTAAMPVTLSAVPPVEASATVSPPSQPQVLSETQTEPLSEATPGPRPAGDQWTREQQDAANRKLSRTYMNNLMRLMNSDRLNLRSVFETLDKLANSDLEDYRADSLTLVDLPNSKTLEYFNNVMHSIQLDLDSGSNNFIPKMSAAKLQRVTAIVKEWQELRLTTRAPLRLSEGNVFELKAALENSNLGRQPVRPTKGNG